MKRVVITVDQLYRAQPGGIGTYVRGLARGLASLEDRDMDLIGLGPRGDAPAEVLDLPLRFERAPLALRALTRLWATWPVGVPRDSLVVHATSMAGPFGGGARGAVHSVALHDLLWRDEPDAATAAGARFHEARLRQLAQREDLRICTSSPVLGARLADEGFSASRIHPIRLGVDDDLGDPTPPKSVRALLAANGVEGPFTLYAGTREPRKNIESLVTAHRAARARHPELGELVLVGSSGWGGVDTGDAVVLGVVARAMLRGLYRDASMLAYVPRAEGWGLPPVEALHAGTRVVASTTTPSVADNDLVVRVDPLDREAITEGLVEALAQSDDEAARARRRASVAEMTWRNCALDHLAAWQ